MQSIAAVPAVATTPTTSAIMSQTLGVTSTWSGGRGSGMQTIREGGSGYVEVAVSRGYTDAWRQQVRRPTWRRSCDLLDPHGERSCAGPSGPDSARPSQWAVAGHVTSVGVGGLDPHGCGR